MADQRCDSHRVIALILTRRGTDIGMGVDPQDRQIIAVTAANSEKGATLTEHSPPSVMIRAGLGRWMTSRARPSWSTTARFASMPLSFVKPTSPVSTGTAAVGPS